MRQSPWRFALQRVEQAWEHVVLYLPVVLMGLLALGSWWLVRNAPQPEEVPQPPPLQHEPDYFMRDFSIQHFDATGRLASELHGTLMRHYLDSDTLEIDQVRVHAVQASGHVLTASAKQAISRADGSEIQLLGNAVVTRHAPDASQPALEFRGEFLQVWVDDERVHSHQPVVITRGNNTLHANRMDYDHATQILHMQGRVQGVLVHGGGVNGAKKQAPSRGL